MDLNKEDIESRVAFLVKEKIEDEHLRNSEISITTPLTYLGINSLKMVALIVALEQEFLIKYPPAFINAELFENIEVIAKHIVDLKTKA